MDSASIGPVEFDPESDALADHYDELPLWSAPFGLLLLEHVPLERGQTILDVGAGTGFLSVELAQRCGPDSKVFAVDPWPAAARRLQRRIRYLGLSNLSVQTTLAEAMAVGDGSVDLVVSNLGVNNFADPAAVLAACFRCCRPGARLLLTTNPVGHMAELYAVYRTTLIESGRSDLLPALAEHERHRGTDGELRLRLQAAGFEVLEVVERSFQMRFADGASLLRHHLIRLGFLPAWAALLPEERRQGVLAALEHALDQLAARQGGLALTIPMVLVVAGRPLG